MSCCALERSKRRKKELENTLEAPTNPPAPAGGVGVATDSLLAILVTHKVTCIGR